MSASNLVVIFRTHSDIEASIVRGLLEAHGINSMMASDVPHSVFPLTVDGLGEVRLSVREADASDATRVIEAHSSGAGRGRLVRVLSDFDGLERRLDYRFRDRDLLECALTHRSRANEDATGVLTDNESLEFLGDAVLGFLVADLLFREFPQFDEGQKSKVKARLVSTAMLARLGRRLDLGEYLVLGRGEEKTGGRRKQALVANAFEAVIAAIYLDGGIDQARAFIRAQLAEVIEQVRQPGGVECDYKSQLQEHLQARDRPLPEYLVVSETGPDHRKLFDIEVRVEGALLAVASGSSKKEAEQEAARRALESLAVGSSE